MIAEVIWDTAATATATTAMTRAMISFLSVMRLLLWRNNIKRAVVRT